MRPRVWSSCAICALVTVSMLYRCRINVEEEADVNEGEEEAEVSEGEDGEEVEAESSKSMTVTG